MHKESEESVDMPKSKFKQHNHCSLWLSILSAVFVLGSAVPLLAQLSTGGSVVSGAATIQRSGAAMTIQQSSQRLGLNWQSFNIGAGNSVNFVQPNASSVALNRVLGNDASSIFGSLQANGSVFLLNPNGVLFAPGAQVSVGGLVASTLNLSDTDFAAGNYLFTDGCNAGSAINQGHIQANNVALLGPQIINSGVITAPGNR